MPVGTGLSIIRSPLGGCAYPASTGKRPSSGKEAIQTVILGAPGGGTSHDPSAGPPSPPPRRERQKGWKGSGEEKGHVSSPVFYVIFCWDVRAGWLPGLAGAVGQK